MCLLCIMICIFQCSLSMLFLKPYTQCPRSLHTAMHPTILPTSQYKQENLRQKVIQDVVMIVIQSEKYSHKIIDRVEAKLLALKISVKLEAYGVTFDDDKFLQAVALNPTLLGVVSTVSRRIRWFAIHIILAVVFICCLTISSHSFHDYTLNRSKSCSRQYQPTLKDNQLRMYLSCLIRMMYMTCFICQEKIMLMKDMHHWQLVVLLLKIGNKDRFHQDTYKSHRLTRRWNRIKYVKSRSSTDYSALQLATSCKMNTLLF